MSTFILNKRHHGGYKTIQFSSNQATARTLNWRIMGSCAGMCDEKQIRFGIQLETTLHICILQKLLNNNLQTAPTLRRRSCYHQQNQHSQVFIGGREEGISPVYRPNFRYNQCSSIPSPSMHKSSGLERIRDSERLIISHYYCSPAILLVLLRFSNFHPMIQGEIFRRLSQVRGKKWRYLATL